MQLVKAHIVNISALTEFVFKVELKPNNPAQFEAGQYLQLVLGEKDKRAFSIASRPSQTDLLELHVGASEENSYAMQALNHLQAHFADNTEVELEVGLGISQLRENSQLPIVLLAGGTGFSYVKSMADHLAEINSNRPVFFYWGVRDESALYAKAEMEAWAATKANFNFVPVVENASSDWQGHTGYVHKAVMKDIMSLEPYEFIWPAVLI
jgi:aquacobalamin reductase/NAD(P)H-flavin reductase